MFLKLYAKFCSLESKYNTWKNNSITGTVGAAPDILGSPIRVPGFNRGSSLPPHPSEVDEQLKQEIVEDVFSAMSQYSAFRYVVFFTCRANFKF